MSQIFDPKVERVLRARAKAALRKRMRGLRASIPASGRASRSERIIERLLALPELERATNVGLFWPIVERAEIDLRPLDRSLRDAGKVIGYPCVREDADGRAEPTLRIASPDDLAERGSIYLEPPEDAPELPLDESTLIVTPALALTPSGDRLGYGIGFYDRLLARSVPPGIAVGIAFDFQIVGELPTTEGDVPVTIVITDEKAYDTREPSSGT